MNHTLSGPFKLPINGAKPNKLVVFLHGVGADGQNLIDLSEDLTEGLENAVFLSPNAPFKYDMFPAGYQWFSLVNRNEDIMYKGIQTALPILKSYIDKNLERYNLTYKDLIILGFSQGTMMALHLALTLDKPCLAVIGFSGTIVKADALKKEIKSKPPIFLTHGRDDQVITVEAHKKTSQALKDMNLHVEDHVIKGLGHGISLEGIELANNFLKNR